MLLLNNRLYHHVGLLSIKHRQYLPTPLWPDETSSTPGKRLLLSNVCGFCRHIKKYKDFSLDLHILKPYDGVCNLLCHCYFLLFLCLLDAHYVLFNLIVIKFSKFGSYCSFRSTNSKQFNAIFWLAGKCGTPLFNNKPALTWLSWLTWKKLVSSRRFNDFLLSAGNNFNYSFSKVLYDSTLQKLWAYW